MKSSQDTHVGPYTVTEVRNNGTVHDWKGKKGISNEKIKWKKIPCINVLGEMLLKNTIYVCSLGTSMDDYLHTAAIVNNWVSISYFQSTINLGQKEPTTCAISPLIMNETDIYHSTVAMYRQV